MPHFAAIGCDPVPHNVPARDRHRSEHRTDVLGNDELLRVAGATVDRQGNQCGSIYGLEADSEDQIARWVTREPFCSKGVYRELRIVEVALAPSRLETFAWRAPGSHATVHPD